MLFNSFAFLLVFLPITYVVFWALKTAQARYVWLTITGYVFYGYWDPRFCLLMFFSTAVSYLAGLGFLRFEGNRARRACLILPITVDLSLLGFFKYADFGIATVHETAHLFGVDISLPQLNIILPIGISFYTFHTISYIIDSYRRVVTPTRNFFEFAAYVSLFSQLVAGPIVRFRQIESDLEGLGRTDRTRWLPAGVSFFVVGLIEKVVVADTLAAFINPAFDRYQELSTAGVWLAMVGYTLQLYFDFSGYSSMAVGLGLLFGLRIPQNFNSPYKALDPSDFWRRWHISLSSCLRDYVYVPLGGNRGGARATYVNLMLTMLIGGLWHGANWTFVAWGAYHGVLLALYKRFGYYWDQVPALPRQFAMFVLVMIGWVFFRSTDFTTATQLLRAMFMSTPGVGIEQPGVYILILAVPLCWALAGPNPFEMIQPGFRWKARYAFALAIPFGACVALMAGGRASPFLYFQF